MLPVALWAKTQRWLCPLLPQTLPPPVLPLWGNLYVAPLFCPRGATLSPFGRTEGGKAHSCPILYPLRGYGKAKATACLPFFTLPLWGKTGGGTATLSLCPGWGNKGRRSEPKGATFVAQRAQKNQRGKAKRTTRGKKQSFASFATTGGVKKRSHPRGQRIPL